MSKRYDDVFFTRDEECRFRQACDRGARKVHDELAAQCRHPHLAAYTDEKVLDLLSKGRHTMNYFYEVRAARYG